LPQGFFTRKRYHVHLQSRRDGFGIRVRGLY